MLLLETEAVRWSYAIDDLGASAGPIGCVASESHAKVAVGDQGIGQVHSHCTATERIRPWQTLGKAFSLAPFCCIQGLEGAQ